LSQRGASAGSVAATLAASTCSSLAAGSLPLQVAQQLAAFSSKTRLKCAVSRANRGEKLASYTV
jgi:hypothetical protein